MSLIILDGTGNGTAAKVNPDHRIAVTAKSEPFQHVVAAEKGQAYQAISEVTVTGSGRYVGLYFLNTSTTRNMIITFARQQLISGSGQATAGPNNYFYTATGRTYLSNGTLYTPVNTSFGSTFAAELTTYVNNPTLQGTVSELDRYYPKDNDLVIYRKEGAVICQPQQSFELGFVTDYTAGAFFSRVSFVMEEKALHAL